MSLLGHGGTLSFSRAPRTAITLTAHDRREKSCTFQTSSHGLWTGDFVELRAEGDETLSPFHETCFVHVDRLQRLSLYTTKHEALAGQRDARMPLPSEASHPLILRPLDADYDVSTEVGDWTLHTDPVYLNEALIERQMGSGMATLCACGGQMSFTYQGGNPRAFTRDITTVYELLEKGESLTAELRVSLNEKQCLTYGLTLSPLAYVLNYRDLPRVDGTLDFASTNPPRLRQL